MPVNLTNPILQRRRTQIRLAQRAYRERKETTISELEKRVAALNEVIGEMNQTFLDYNAKAISSGILSWNSTLGGELKEATERFLHLAKAANLDASGDDNEQSLQESHQETERETTQSQPPVDQHERNWMDPTVEIPQRYQTTTSADMWGYDFTYDNSAPREIQSTDNSEHAVSLSYKPCLRSGWNWMDQADDAAVLTKQQDWLPSISRTLKSPHTYSFQETTFARRLYRAGFERVYCLLRDPSVPQEVVQRKLRFTFAAGQDHKTIERNILNILSRNSREPLLYWEYPEPCRTRPSHHPFGPLTEEEAHLLSAQELARIANIDGTWFDPDDVERYFKEKGLHLNGSSSLVEMEVDDSLPPLAMDAVGNSPQSISTESFENTPSPVNFTDGGISLFGMSNNASMPSGDTSCSGFPLSSSHNVALDFTASQPPYQTAKAVPDAPLSQAGLFSGLFNFDFTPGKRRVTVNVDKLVDSKCMVRCSDIFS